MNNAIFSRLLNPGQFLSPEVLKNPQAAVQQLLNSGRMSQQQFNQVRQMAMNIQGSPMFAQMFNKR